MTDRVVVLVDMDCFYCQVETRLNPALQGLPVAVVQYNQWQGGGIIAVNYEARDRGVTRHMRGKEAKEQCPELILVSVPTLRDKADLTRYREAGQEVVSVLCTFSECVERASVDEAYIDLTSAVNRRITEKTSQVFSNDLSNTFIVGYSKEGCNNEEEREHELNSWLKDVYDDGFQDIAAQKLAVGATIVEDMRKAIFESTGFKCSAGIAHNKILAKLACGLHKPNRQTVIPQSSVPGLFKTLPAKKIRYLGGKLGDDLTDRLGIKFMADLLKYSESELQKTYDSKTGTWLYNISRGYDYETVTPRLLSKSIGCCKKFPGRTALKTASEIQHWITKLAEELHERLTEDQIKNKRRAQLLTVSFGLEINKKDISTTKSLSFTTNNLDKIISDVYGTLKKTCAEDPESKIWSPPIKYLGISAGKFVNESSNKIINFFKATNIVGEENTMKLSQQKENLLPVERMAIVGESNNNEMNNSNTPIASTESSRSSFFEKMFFRTSADNEGKLNILPDLNRHDTIIDSECSRDSCISLSPSKKNTNVSEDVKTCLKEETDRLFKNKSKNWKEGKAQDTCKPNISKTNNKSITSFFSSIPVKEKWISPEEIFPDISKIDADIIEMLPPSFKRKIIELKNTVEKSVELNHINKDITLPSTSFKNNQEDNVQCVRDDGSSLKDEEFQTDTYSDSDIFDSPDTKNNASSEHTKCEECGENIPITDKNTHLDFHLAKKLDKEINHENISRPVVINSRNTVKKLVNSAQTKKKRKSKNNDTKSKDIKKTKGIEAFFIK